jgi:hypothetical protein
VSHETRTHLLSSTGFLSMEFAGSDFVIKVMVSGEFR